jgi:malonyl CoA-acyl carrier protein transacylase
MREDRSTALMFSGQGSRCSGTRELVAEQVPELLEAAIELVGGDPFERIDDGTRFAQPAHYCATIASWEAAGRPVAVYHAGHSLGELAALVTAGAMTVEEGLRLAALRGELTQRAAEAADEGGMLAVLGNGSKARALARRLGLTVANDNSPGQVVLSGPVPSLSAAARAARVADLRSVRLAIHGAFHSPAMEPAVPGFRAALARIEFRLPQVPVFSSITAQPFDDVRARLAEALVRPVRWRQTLFELKRAGVGHFAEIGPGRVLTGLVERTLTGVEVVPASEIGGGGG